MIAAARNFVQNPDHILTLYGGYGNGKTDVLKAIVQECVNRGITAVYLEMKVLADTIRQAYAEHNDTASRLIDRYARVRVLALDEMDKVNDTDWYQEFETGLMSQRYQMAMDHTAGTVLAMNQHPNNALPGHLASRLFDGRNSVIHNTDPDLRPLMKS